ncbi:MAG: 6-phosphogluconate dehydrogenase [Rhodospirillaceae bacterium]|nr:6-phosphogluconate dehydrogenase [Rhodospirillaceae bacterium]
MSIKTVAIQSPGDMGHGVGRVLVEAGFETISSLEGRSDRTRDLASKAKIMDIGGLSNLLGEADVILSIMRPDMALSFVKALTSLGSVQAGRPIIVDLNAVAPATGRAAAEVAEKEGFGFVDGGIIGAPPNLKTGYQPRLYVSGPRAWELTVLNEAGLDFRVLDDRIGSASAIKMCYAALTKGLTAIGIHSMVTARLEGVDEALMSELRFSQKDILNHLEGGLPSMCPKAHRWIGEMKEISKTHVDSGLPGELFLGAARIYETVTGSPLGAEIIEDRKRGNTATEVADLLIAHIQKRKGAVD